MYGGSGIIEDGIHWTETCTSILPGTNDNWGTMSCGNGVFGLINTSAANLTPHSYGCGSSPDGVTWSGGSLPLLTATTGSGSVVYGGWVIIKGGSTGFVICGEVSTGAGITYLGHSTNGTSYTTFLSNVTGTNITIAYGNSSWVLIGGSAVVLISTNGGSTYTQQTSTGLPTTNFTCLAYSNGYFLTAGTPVSGICPVYVSNTGATWIELTTVSSTHAYNLIAADNTGRFVMTTFDVNISSMLEITVVNAVSYTVNNITTISVLPNAIAYGNGIFLSTGRLPSTGAAITQIINVV